MRLRRSRNTQQFEVSHTSLETESDGLVVRSGHGPQAEVAQVFGLQPLVELGGRHLEGPEEEQRNEEEKETGEEKQPQRNTQVHMHGWDDACKADLSHGAM